MLLRSTEKYVIFCSFQILIYFYLPTFAENMNSVLPSNRILPYFEEVLVNALSLQNYRDF